MRICFQNRRLEFPRKLSIEVIDAGLIDENWLFLAFFDASRNPVKLKLCWDSVKVREYRVFLNELWHRAHPSERIRIQGMPAHTGR